MAGRVRVCHFLAHLAMGGLERQVIRFIRASESEVSHTVCYFYSDDSLKREFEDLNVNVVSLGTNSDNHVSLLNPRMLYSTTRFLREGEFDILHCHTPLLVVLFGRICGKLAGIPVVGTFHNTPDNFHPTVRIGERLLRPLSKTNICVSKGVERSYSGSAREYSSGVEQLDRDTFTVYNGIDVDGFSENIEAATPDRVASKWGISGEPVFLSVGRYTPVKNQECLIRAMHEAKDEMPDAHLLLVGSGECEADLKAAVREYGLEDSVTITGEVPSIHEYYAFADVFVLPSLSEGLSLVLLEAMVAKLPVVATDVEGNGEAIVDGETGYLVPPGSPSELADALVRIGRHPHREQFGREGYRRVSEKFDIRHHVRSYLDIYRRCSGLSELDPQIAGEVLADGTR